MVISEDVAYAILGLAAIAIMITNNHHACSRYFNLKIFMSPPEYSTHKNEGAPINLEHPLVRFVLLGMRLLRTHKFPLYDFDYRDNQRYNVCFE
jgi:hypothetical protein